MAGPTVQQSPARPTESASSTNSSASKPAAKTASTSKAKPAKQSDKSATSKITRALNSAPKDPTGAKPPANKSTETQRKHDAAKSLLSKNEASPAVTSDVAAAKVPRSRVKNQNGKKDTTRPTLSDGKVEREIWRPSDGNGDPSPELVEKHRARKAGHPTWKLYTGRNIPKRPTDTNPPSFVYLDDKAAWDILHSNHWTPHDKHRFWTFDFTAQGRVTVTRPNRGRPAYEEDDKTFASIPARKGKRYWFHGCHPAPMDDGSSAESPVLAKDTAVDEASTAAVPAKQTAVHTQDADKEEAPENTPIEGQPPVASQPLVFEQTSVVEHPSEVEQSTAPKQRLIPGQTSMLEQAPDSIPESRDHLQTSDQEQRLTTEEEQVISIEGPLAKTAPLFELTTTNSEHGSGSGSGSGVEPTDLVPLQSVPQDIVLPTTPLPNAKFVSLNCPTPSSDHQAVVGQPQQQLQQAVRTASPAPESNETVSRSPAPSPQAVKRLSSPDNSMSPAPKRQRKGITPYDIPPEVQMRDLELLQLRQQLRDCTNREVQHDNEMAAMRQKAGFYHRAVMDSSAKLETSEKKEDAFRRLAIQLYARAVDQQEMLAELHKELLKIREDSANLTAAAERLATDARRELDPVSAMHGDLDAILDESERVMQDAGLQEEFETFVQQAMVIDD
ncbi:cell division protein [Diplodia corticola]|uniref:Cell division protein n=1 Tax=Diplodia corticola TaxID=236234 RepID=A0A1J9SLQ0_9PEZI|nr:cell division protein [Diplodia corticola]OJD40541.1 cell division protein [Diplodia corticola]